MSIDELIKFHLVFDTLDIEKSYDDIFEAIENEILAKYQEFRFGFDSDTKKALMKFAKNDRKKYSINRYLPHYKATRIVNELLESGFLELELSREQKPTPKHKHEKLPKRLRRYVIHDKVNFSSHFTRFWFRFIEPNLALLELGKSDILLDIIKDDFDNYLSLGFEMLSQEVLAKKFNLNLEDVYSFWTKELEMDILTKFDDKFIVGEVKYKGRKVCKSVLNLINARCEKLGIEPDIITIFSRSGYSKELRNVKDKNLLLFGLDDFKILVE